MKKISMVFAVGIVMFTLAGCVPGETVVTISADDVGCVMTGGVGRAEVVSTLTNTIPKIDRSRISKLALEQLGLSVTNTALEAVQKVLKETECIYSAFLPKGDSVKLSVKEKVLELKNPKRSQFAGLKSQQNKVMSLRKRSQG